MGELVVPARRSPDGWVAQRAGQAINGHGPWLLTSVDFAAGGVQLKVLTDDDVVMWPSLLDALRPAAGDVLAHAEWFFRQASQPNTGSDTEKAFAAIVAELERLRGRVAELEADRG